MWSPFVWRNIAILFAIASIFALSMFAVLRAGALFPSLSLPFGIVLRAASFVCLLLSLFALLLTLDLFQELEFAYDWRPNVEWHKIQLGTTRQQVIDLLGEPDTHIRFEYYYLLFPMHYDEGQITFEGDPSKLEDYLKDTVGDDAKVIGKTPDETRKAWLPGGFQSWLFNHVRSGILPLSAITLLILLVLSMIPFSLRDGWNSWILYVPVMAAAAAALYEFAMHEGWRFDLMFLYPAYLLIVGTWGWRVWAVMTSAHAK